MQVLSYNKYVSQSAHYLEVCHEDKEIRKNLGVKIFCYLANVLHIVIADPPAIHGI